MINTGLDRKYTANAGGGMDFSPIPDGDYRLKIADISPWKEQKKTIKVIIKDEYGNTILDEKGDKKTETVKDCVFYNANIKFEVVEGDYKGRLVFHNITTHPNMNWTIDNLLYALNLKELSASQIQTNCKGLELIGKVYTDKYVKKVQNKETGIDEDIEKEINRIKSLKPLETPQTNNESDFSNLGI